AGRSNAPRSRFMVPMRVQSLEVEASHEPERRSPIRRVSSARTKLAGSETDAPIQRFIGREQVRKEHGAFHEPCPLTLILSPGWGEETRNRFMVPMRIQSFEVEAAASKQRNLRL